MATYFARSNGNVNGAIWATTPSGSASTYFPFTASDILMTNGFTVTINVNTTAQEVRNDATGGATIGGQFSISNNITLTANAYSGSTTPILAALGAITATLVGNLTGGTANSSVHGIQVGNAASVFNITGVLRAGIGSSANGVYLTGGTVNVTGGVIGNASHGINAAGSSTTVNVTGYVLGSNWGGSAYGIYAAASSVAVTLNGSTTGDAGHGIRITGANSSCTITGNAYGSDHSTGAYGVSCEVSTATVSVSGTAIGGKLGYGLYNTAGTCTVKRAKGNDYPTLGYLAAPGVGSAQTASTTVYEIEYGTYGQSPTAGPINFYNNTTNLALFLKASSSSKKTLVDSSVAADVPSTINVRNATVYNSSSNTGTCIIPSASNVVYGVSVDASTGTANLPPQSIYNALISGINTSNSMGERLKNSATANSVSNQVTIAKGS